MCNYSTNLAINLTENSIANPEFSPKYTRFNQEGPLYPKSGQIKANLPTGPVLTSLFIQINPFPIISRVHLHYAITFSDREKVKKT